MVLNEPETSLHPELIPPLARLISQASKRSQIIIVSHSAILASELEQAGASTLQLYKDTGETVVPDAEDVQWTWLKR